MTVTDRSGPIVIAGGSGFLGVSLATHLANTGYSVVVLSRRRPKISGPWRHVDWDARTLGEWRRELDGASGLVNLVGRSVDCVKTPEHCDEILRSRTEATRVLGLAVRSVDSPPPVWVQMSTAHIYGDPPEVTCTEDSPFGYGLAPFVGRAWEEEFERSILPSQRGVILRTGFVLGRDRGAGGGALARLRTLVKLCLGGRVGSGRQGMSWIHETDLNRLFERALVDERMRGGVYRVIATSRFAARVHARPSPRVEVSHRPAGHRVDGALRCAVVAQHRSGTRSLRTLRNLQASRGGEVRVSVSGAGSRTP